MQLVFWIEIRRATAVGASLEHLPYRNKKKVSPRGRHFLSATDDFVLCPAVDSQPVVAPGESQGSFLGGNLPVLVHEPQGLRVADGVLTFAPLGMQEATDLFGGSKGMNRHTDLVAGLVLNRVAVADGHIAIHGNLADGADIQPGETRGNRGGTV